MAGGPDPDGSVEGEASSGSLRITSAEWRDSPEPRALVRGEWGVGTSTPPTCALLSGEEPAGRYDQEAGTELDGSLFSSEFARERPPERTTGPAPRYEVRCEVFISTGAARSVTAPVEGDPP